MQAKLTEIAIEKYKPDILVKVSKEACGIYEFHRSEEMIDYGGKQLINCLKMR